MDNQKIETVFQLALDTPELEREKSGILNVGYETNTKQWELIVKYHGNISQLASENILVEELIAGYAIVTIPENYISSFLALEEVEYVEKPKRLYFQLLREKTVSCIPPIQNQPPNLTGEGCIVAIIDSGINPFLPDFKNESGDTRIIEMWDQSYPASPDRGWLPPEGFAKGVVLNRDQIREMFLEFDEVRNGYPGQDITGHGTAVAAIAAGSGEIGRGVAYNSSLVIVKLGRGTTDSFPKTTELMRALTYVARLGVRYNLPVAVNLSFGNTYGAHNGASLLERFIDNIAEIGRMTICVGSGNEGTSAGHVEVKLSGEEKSLVELAVGNRETSLNIQLWKSYVDEIGIRIISPDGSDYILQNPAISGNHSQSIILENTRVLIYVGEPAPYSVNQEIFFDMIPLGDYVNPGIWTIELAAKNVVNGNAVFYLPSQAARNIDTRFFAPSPAVTLTIPSTSGKVITVGAYDALFDVYADFSGRGYVIVEQERGLLSNDLEKPDIVAPGVDINVPSIYGGRESVSGTSFSTPFVTGSAALLMEWGIINGNDPYLYGEKVKAYFRKGARKLPGEANYPNDRVGYGALCVADSIPLAGVIE